MKLVNKTGRNCGLTNPSLEQMTLCPFDVVFCCDDPQAQAISDGIARISAAYALT